MTPAELLNSKCLSLRAALDASSPEFPLLLREIHGKLLEDPENVTLIKPEDMRTVIDALKAHKKIVLTESPTKVSAGTKKRLSTLSADDL
jgi:hypothetical protein